MKVGELINRADELLIMGGDVVDSGLRGTFAVRHYHS